MNGGRKPLSDHARLGGIASDVAGDGRNRSRDAEEVAIGQQALRSARRRRPGTIMAGEVAARLEDASGGGRCSGVIEDAEGIKVRSESAPYRFSSWAESKRSPFVLYF
ncbi:hypothetical protein HPP92_011771 [Vanilla planifolia]|uniref:Uncharacterized protein n=1 Tax=Vanilla planifolia TaxID=51239 RepID=A0A835RD05_VANPL|nr:hypothetical protein HPP92_011771 [Vanilla planifolia]